MSNNHVNRQSVENVPSWDWAIRDAKERIKRLRESIRVFERMRDTGEPWRGSTQTAD